MKIAVFSDTHGYPARMIELVEQYMPDHVIHLGDCVKDVSALKKDFPWLSVNFVAGNNDFFEKNAPQEQIFELAGKRFLITHGHRQKVKLGQETLCRAGRIAEADVILFGHTHRATNIFENDRLLFNPGSLSYPADGLPSWGLLEIDSGKITAQVKREVSDQQIKKPFYRR